MQYLILGAGRMARGLVHFLVERDSSAKIKVVDVSPKRSRDLAKRFRTKRVTAGKLDLEDRKAVRRALKNVDVALSAAHYRFNDMLTDEAARTKTHLVDLGGNNDVVASQLKRNAAVAKKKVTVVPDTGLAPGLTSILAMQAIDGMDRVHRLRIRVGGVPLRPQPPLGYQLVFSTEGLLNEYVEDALVLRGGRKVKVASLTEVEPVRFPPPFGLMEAFHTSGGSSTLVKTLKGRVKELDYKTIRYAGHCVRMNVLKELGYMSNRPVKVGDDKVVPRDLTRKLLESSLPTEGEDAVLVLVTAEGVRDGSNKRVRMQLIDRADGASGLSAMMRCTAFPSACIAWMLAEGIIDKPGVHPQENVVPVKRFITEMRKAGLRIRRQST